MQVIAHREAAALAPENTWAGFDMALTLGVDAIETDDCLHLLLQALGRAQG
jgi:glycerophosphoryl diester phosphodiesterase